MEKKFKNIDRAKFIYDMQRIFKFNRSRGAHQIESILACKVLVQGHKIKQKKKRNLLLFANLQSVFEGSKLMQLPVLLAKQYYS